MRLTKKGQTFWKILDGIFKRHVEMLEEAELQESALATVSQNLKGLDQFWNMARNRVPRPPEPLVGRPVTPEEAQTYFDPTRRSASAH
mgnify:FL=1